MQNVSIYVHIPPSAIAYQCCLISGSLLRCKFHVSRCNTYVNYDFFCYQNHSCTPNMEYELYGKGQRDCLPVLVYKTKRRIQPGEELTVSYYPENMLVSHFTLP
jgi:SET domain-containing protein